MINLELLTEKNIDAVRAIHREDIPVSWVDNADTLWELTQYGLEHNCIGHTYAIKQDDDYIGVILLGEAIPWETDPEEMTKEPSSATCTCDAETTFPDNVTTALT